MGHTRKVKPQDVLMNVGFKKEGDPETVRIWSELLEGWSCSFVGLGGLVGADLGWGG